MSREKLKPEELKIKLSIRIHPELFKIITDNYSNKSKYLERLVYEDLLTNNKIDKNILL
jgi:flagellar biosynthesis/type III secretory pathway protein FliH